MHRLKLTTNMDEAISWPPVIRMLKKKLDIIVSNSAENMSNTILD